MTVTQHATFGECPQMKLKRWVSSEVMPAMVSILDFILRYQEDINGFLKEERNNQIYIQKNVSSHNVEIDNRSRMEAWRQVRRLFKSCKLVKMVAWKWRTEKVNLGKDSVGYGD